MQQDPVKIASQIVIDAGVLDQGELEHYYAFEQKSPRI